MHKDCGIDGLTFKRPSLTKPHFAADCDLANIVHKFLNGGQLPQNAFKQPLAIEDITCLPYEFQDLMDRTIHITQEFDQLPIEVRNHYNNDPLSWYEDKIKPKQPEPEKAVSEPGTSEDNAKA